MLILALDSSTGVVTVAVARAGEDAPGAGEPRREVLAEISVPSRGASETLLPAAHAALNLAGADLGEVERILVGVGPGTFTGIRIALAAARALALATSAALSRNSTLNALAAPALLCAGNPDVLAVLDAKRRQVFAQLFASDGLRGEILCAAPGELAAQLPVREESREKDMLLVGDGAVRYREELSGLGRIPAEASPLHRVTATGHVLSADFAPVPASEVVPLYVREPDAEVRRDLNPWSRS
ncbi:MAG: tRNA (adenosine(37)-N6)-threonylcarbamoyltransferase complex dimerization subunit type 1 TsaB [Actinobacteria bacterium]|nr:tRNA (adenosine(37)-N6)-threonylcarbamoyltransferase complex dimerization subunit type 1 TsaB [Actinomycetota bacterium]